jgi:hypothetical protein
VSATPEAKPTHEADAIEEGEFGELLRFTFAGYVGGFLLGLGLDGAGLQRSAVGQWLVRTLAGEGESILEGGYALRQRLRRGPGSMAEAYGWGKLLGMAIPWVIDWGSRLAGVDMYGVPGFYIPFFYAMTDQIGGNVSGFVFLWRRAGGVQDALAAYVRHPVMVAGLGVLLIVPAGLLGARLLGFSPNTQLLTALETIVANLCWLPPTVGWLAERRARSGTEPDGHDPV